MLGVAMAVPMIADLMYGNTHWTVFAESAIITIVIGLSLIHI